MRIRFSHEELLEEYHNQLKVDNGDAAERRKRGYFLENALYSVLFEEGLSPRTSYLSEGEQIDGSFYVNQRVYLLEAKWHSKPIPASDVYSFRGKVEGKLTGTIGVFVSMSGYSEDTPGALVKGKALDTVLFDRTDIESIIEGAETFMDVLDFKLRCAGETGDAYVQYKLPEEIVKATSGQLVSKTFDLSVDIEQPEQWYLQVVCEGTLEKGILELLFQRLINENRMPEDMVVRVANVGTDVVQKLPEVINTFNSERGYPADGVVIVLNDSQANSLDWDELWENVDNLGVRVSFTSVYAHPDLTQALGLDSSANLKDQIDQLDLDSLGYPRDFAYRVCFFAKTLTIPEEPWVLDARKAVRDAIVSWEWDETTKAITLHEDEWEKTCYSYEDLTDGLEEMASRGSENSMPYEGGEPVFDIDVEEIVYEELENHLRSLREFGWEIPE